MTKPNILFLGVDSMRRDHMSMYGYPKLTTPHLDKLMQGGTVFNNSFSPSIPTTPGYASMLTGRDCFGTDIVKVFHDGEIAQEAIPLAKILEEQGYNTSCFGATGNVACAGFQKYFEYNGWGSWKEGRSHKAGSLNSVAIPEMERLLGEDKPFFMFLRHMDPHSPYLPPEPFDRMFYGGDETDPNDTSLDEALSFEPFCDFLADWINPEATDKDYMIAQYDGELAYMDSCITQLIETLKAHDQLDNTLIVLTSDHGETLYDHGIFFDHHGLYDCTIVVPIAFRWPGKVPAGKRCDAYVQVKDIVPTIVELMGIDTKAVFDGRSLVPEMYDKADPATDEPGIYITECTWMRKHGWRTPEWKLIWSLEPDFHWKPEYELFNLINDPDENNNLAEQMPEMVEMFKNKILKHCEKRSAAVGRKEAPIYRNYLTGDKPFTSSQEAYDNHRMPIGTKGAAKAILDSRKRSK